MMYQWGRKDPFTPFTSIAGKDTQLYSATGTPINTKSSNGIGGEWTYASTASNITVLTSKPSTHFGSSVPIASTGNLSNDWWNPKIKTLYDPCPSGYRTPPANTFNGFPNSPTWSSNINNGMKWSGSFFPASGCRKYSNGQFVGVGSSGHAYMSTPGSATYGYYLGFYSGALYPSYANYRSYSMPVRCISE